VIVALVLSLPDHPPLTGTERATRCFYVMSTYAVMERSIEIAWDYLERTGQIHDPEFTSKFLLKSVEHAVRKGERRQLMLSNLAISAYERARTSPSLA
jgi:hypothetical protein